MTDAAKMLTAILLTVSNIFMTFAWYGHLKFKDHPLWIVVLVSWGIAFVEYCFQVPANRYGHAQFSAAQLKIMQEVISLTVSFLFFAWYLRETPRWNEYLGMFLLAAAVYCMFALNPRTRAQAMPPNHTASTHVSESE